MVYLQAMYKNTAFPISKMLRYLQHMEEFLHGTWVLVGSGGQEVSINDYQKDIRDHSVLFLKYTLSEITPSIGYSETCGLKVCRKR